MSGEPATAAPRASAFAAAGAALRGGWPNATEKLTQPTIVAATDFSEPAGAAVMEASHLAARLGARLVVVHVLTLAPIAHGDFIWVPTAQQIEASTRNAEEALRKTLGEVRLAHADLQVETHISSGLLPDALVDLAGEQNADLLVVGSHGRGFWSGLVLGSVARAVSVRSPVPVLTVRAGTRDDKAPTILAPVELGRVAESALDFAVGLALASKARLRLLYVFPADGSPELEPGSDAAGSIAIEGQRELERLAGAERLASLEVESVTRFGRPARQIAEEARACRAAFVVMGARRHGIIQRATHGSVVEDVLNGTDRPIVTVPVREAAKD